MDAARHEKLRELFVGASDRAGIERATFLDDACGDDAALRRDIEELLAHDERPDLRARAMSAGAGAHNLAVAIGAMEKTRNNDDNDEETLPRTLGRYTLLRVIGRGGMGVVYEAQQEDPSRRVALKIVRPGQVTRSLLQRFRQEVQVLGQLQHPGIAQIYDAGAADTGEGGQPYFAMEYVDGRPLLEFADEKRLGPRERLELVVQICDAVHHAHLRGVIHRDLKPANILVVEAATVSRAGSRTGTTRSTIGQPKILDFGVARLIDADFQTVTVETSAGELIGTVPYMSPEQAAGDPAGIDIRSDVYGIGVTAYELLAGRLPYETGGKMIHEAVRVIQEHEPSRLSAIDRAFRGDVETIIGKALEKEKERRYQSADAFAEDIRHYLHDEPIEARPASALYQLRKFARRNRALAAGVTVAFAAMIIATVVSVWQASAARTAESNAEVAWGLADARAFAAEQSAWVAYRSSIAGAAVAIDMGAPDVAWLLLEGTDSTLRRWEAGYLLAQVDAAVAVLQRPADLAAAGLAADGRIVTVTSGGAVTWWDSERPATPERVLTLDADDLRSVVISADGTCVAAIVGETRDAIVMWDARSGERVAALTPADVAAVVAEPRALDRIAISADASTLFTAGIGGGIDWVPGRDQAVIPVPRGRQRTGPVALSRGGGVRGWGSKRSNDAGGYFAADSFRGRYRHGTNQITAVAVSDDGSRGLIGATDALVVLIDMVTRERLHIFEGHTSKITSAAIAPDGRLGATGARDGTVRLWDLEALEPRGILPGHTGAVTTVMFAQDGGSLLTVDDKAVRVLELGRDVRETVLRGHRNSVYDVGFTADGARVVSGAWDGALRVWDAATGATIAEINTGTKRVICIAAPPAGSYVVTGHEGGRVKAWCVDTGRLLWETRVGGGRVAAADASPDGRHLVVRTRLKVMMLEPTTGDVLQVIEVRGDKDDMGAVAISNDGRYAACEYRSGIVLWTIATGAQRLLEGHKGRVDALDFSPDGAALASGSRDTTVRLWDIATGDTKHVLRRHANRVYGLAFSPDGARLASGSDDRMIVVWDTTRGDFLLDLDGHQGYVIALAFSPDGTQLVSGAGDTTVRVWDASNPRERTQAATRLRAARAAAEALVDRHQTGTPNLAAVAAAIRADATLTPDVREAALQSVLRRSMASSETP